MPQRPKSAVFTKDEWELYKQEINKIKKIPKDEKFKNEERPDAINETMRVYHRLPENVSVNSKVAETIMKDKLSASLSNPKNAYLDYKVNLKHYDRLLDEYAKTLKLAEKYRKDSKEALEIISDPNWVARSGAPMDNTIIHFDTPIFGKTSTEILTPQLRLNALGTKPKPSVIDYTLMGATALPVIYLLGAPIASSIVTNPVSWATAAAGGWLGTEGVNSGIRLFTDYNSWGDVMADTRLGKYVINELGPDVGKPLLEFTNIGGIGGSIKGWNLGRGGDMAINTYRLARELNKSVKNFDGTVGESYFHAPDKWYRITSSPEIYGIKELGMNVTTHDLSGLSNSADDFRNFVRENNLVPGTGKNEGYWVLPKNVRELVLLKKIAEETGGSTDQIIFPNDFRKYGAAHGNRTLGAWQLKWGGSTSTDIDFPGYVLEGNPLPDLTIPFGKGRSKFRITPIEDIEAGSRIGFKTGEMPIEGLRQFRLLPNGRYKYEGELIPDKIIKTDGTSILIPRTNSMSSF